MRIVRRDDADGHNVLECDWRGMIRSDLDACKFQDLMGVIDDWVIKRELGYRKGYNIFGLYNEQASVMFLIRWRDIKI
jgi:lysozyme family protein